MTNSIRQNRDVGEQAPSSLGFKFSLAQNPLIDELQFFLSVT